MNRSSRGIRNTVRAALASGVLFAVACDGGGVTSSKSGAPTSNSCAPAGTLTLAVAGTARIDCSGGGTMLTLAGNGASDLIVPQFPSDQVPAAQISYQLFSGSVRAAAVSASIRWPSASRTTSGAALAGTLPRGRNMAAQRAAEAVLRARAALRPRSALLRASRSQSLSASLSATVNPPALNSLRSFHVASSFTAATWATVTARLAYAGSNVLVYIDTLAPANGFTPAQVTAFGTLFDQTLFPIDTAAFGPPSDLDGNGRVIMLMTPVVNADTPRSSCSQGFIAGFFDSGDFDGPKDPNSNQGELFYSVVPDPQAKYSCSLSVAGVDATVPGTFLHEVQHLINYSQHVVVSGGAPGSSWLDEGMSIVAEELGSLYYERKCPPPACRTSPAQLFPDSSQGFIGNALADSYAYALRPDTSTITLSTDDQGGFSWRGGAWLFSRWLGDQMGSTVYRQLERGPSNGIADLQQVTGQSFPSLFANFGLSLYTDSLPGLARATAPAANRFVSRNVKQLWARLFATSGPSSTYPYQTPLLPAPMTADSTTLALLPGTMTFFRLDTPATASTVTIQFAAPGGSAFNSRLQAQLAVFRLPTGQ